MLNILFIKAMNNDNRNKPLFEECGFNEVCNIQLDNEPKVITLMPVFFYLFFIFFGSIGITFTIVSRLLDSSGEISKDDEDSEDEESEEESEENEDSEKNYPYKYSDVFEALNETPHEPLTVEEKRELKTKVICETTPKGNVVMFYYFNEKELDASSFHYYCDDRSIQFNYLDTVARKYVTTYNCPELYLYLKTEIKKGVEQIKAEVEKEKAEAERIKEENEQAKKEASVFASFKNYKKPDAPQKKIRRLLVGKNRYTRLGNIEDWNVTQQPKAESNVKNISFAEYKKRLESS